MKLAALACALSLVVQPSPSEACSCMRSMVRGFPDAHVAAPINTHVFLWVPTRMKKPTLVLRQVSATGKQPEIAVDQRQVGMAGFDVVELIPRQPLKPNTDYAVVDEAKEVDARRRIVLEFTTSTATDLSPPVWGGISRVRMLRDQVVCCMCQTGYPYAEFDIPTPTDDTTDSKQLVVAVWIANARGEIDYTTPPATIVRQYDGFHLGHPSSCSDSNFDFPKQSSLKLGVKLYDLAGNASDAVDVRFATSKPLLLKHP